eukprot:jgi/Botrbrau1/9787/Bobra.85_1s0031.1
MRELLQILPNMGSYAGDPTLEQGGLYFRSHSSERKASLQILVTTSICTACCQGWNLDRAPCSQDGESCTPDPILKQRGLH